MNKKISECEDGSKEITNRNAGISEGVIMIMGHGTKLDKIIN